MCPVCIAAAALVAGKATSTGGVAALVVKKFRAKKLDEKSTTEKSLSNSNHEGEIK